VSFTQQVHVCTVHEECNNIICVNDDSGEVVWESHDHTSVDPAERINPDVPADDYRDQPASGQAPKLRRARRNS
jgi:hypothetical protein